MTIIVFLSLIILIYFCFRDFRNITKYIKTIFDDRMKFSKYSDSFISKNIKNRKRKKVKRKTSVSNKYNSSIIKNEIDPENIIKQNYKSISLTYLNFP